MYALAPPHRRGDRDGPVVRRDRESATDPTWANRKEGLYFHCASGFRTCPMTRAHVRLLGPCFKTGRTGDRPIRYRRQARPRDTRPLKNRGRKALATVPLSRTTQQRRGPRPTAQRSSSVRRRANAIRVYNTVAEATVTFPERF